MAKKIIYSANLQDYRPVIWYGQPVYVRYNQLHSILLEGMGEEYAEFMAEPLIKNGRACWLSSWITNGTEFTKLNPQRQEYIRGRLQDMLNKIKAFAQQLQNNPDPHQKEFGELLGMATEVPGLENVLVENDRIVLVAWGFSSEKSFRENFKLDTKIARPIEAQPLQTMASEAEENTPAPTPSSDPHDTISDTSSTKAQSADTMASEAKDTTPPPPPPTDGGKGRRGMPGWLWFLIGVLLTLLVVFLLRNCSDEAPKTADNKPGGLEIPDEIARILPPPSVVPPVDTTKIITDPDDPGKRKILSDKVNVALAKGADMKAFATKLLMKYRNDLKVTYYDTAIKLVQLQVPDGEYKQWIAKLKEFTEVKLAFPNTLFSSGYVHDVDDPDFSDRKKSWYFDVVEAQQAWDITMGDSSVIVAVADNCFDLSHPELAGKLVNPYNVTTGNGDVHMVAGADNMHGTHVAGTAVGNCNNTGLCGIAPDCKLMPVQLADDNGNMQIISVMAGILYAIHHGASVINLSLGMYFGELSPAEQQELFGYYADEASFWNELFQFAIDENCVVVLAAGNENIQAGCDPFARSSKVLVVSAFQPDEANPKADFSNHGKYANVSAPGVQIYSSTPGNRYQFLDGTSMASPIVAGAAALLKSKYPSLKAQEIISIIRNTARPLQSSPQIGPLLQIAQALNSAGGGQLLNIPSDAVDLSFAEGKWRSTTELYSTEHPDVRVDVLFELKADGHGTVTYKESTGGEFSAPLDVTFQDGKLVMRQTTEAVSSQSSDTYDPGIYTCEQQEGGAQCSAVWDTDESSTDFHMKKMD